VNPEDPDRLATCLIGGCRFAAQVVQDREVAQGTGAQ
jgi:hypothetical protein